MDNDTNKVLLVVNPCSGQSKKRARDSTKLFAIPIKKNEDKPYGLPSFSLKTYFQMPGVSLFAGALFSFFL